MLDGDRNSRSANRLAWLVGGSLILLAIAGLTIGLSQQGRYQQIANDQTDKYARYADEKAGQACQIVTGIEQSRCLSDAKRTAEQETSDKQREYDDLVAQQTSALWTAIMGVAAITGMILSVIGVWLVYATFRETRRTANEAMRTADLAEGSHRSFLEGERGHIKFSYADCDERGGHIKIYLHLRNNGKSHVEVTGLAIDAFDGEVWPESEIALMQGFQVKIASDTDAQVTHDMCIPINLPCLIVGYIEYKTLLLYDRRTYFAMTINRGKPNILGGSVYNLSTVEPIRHPIDT